MRMKRSPELRPVPWDALVVLAVVLLAAGSLLAMRRGFGAESGELTAVVTVDGQEVDRFALGDLLSEPRTYTGHGITLEVCAAVDGAPSPLSARPSEAVQGLRVIRSDCPTQDCVRTGVITRSGQSIVCLPGRIIIRLEGGAPEEDNGLDAVIG